MVATFEILLPAAPAVKTTSKTAVAPAAKVAFEQGKTFPGQVKPAPGLTETNVAFAGVGSFKVTFVAPFGPTFAIAITNVTG